MACGEIYIHPVAGQFWTSDIELMAGDGPVAIYRDHIAAQRRQRYANPAQEAAAANIQTIVFYHQAIFGNILMADDCKFFGPTGVFDLGKKLPGHIHRRRNIF